MPGIRTTLLGAGLGLLGLIGTAAAAVPAYTNQEDALRAGPGAEYPDIAPIEPGQPAEIFGCVGGWTWCDVDVQGVRGWIYGPELEVQDEGREVGVDYYGPRFGLPVIGFELGDYWGRFYHDRPFFAERDRWGQVQWNRGGSYPGQGYGGPRGWQGPGRPGPGGFGGGPDHGRPGNGSPGGPPNHGGPGPGPGPAPGPGPGRPGPQPDHHNAGPPPGAYQGGGRPNGSPGDHRPDGGQPNRGNQPQ